MLPRCARFSPCAALAFLGGCEARPCADGATYVNPVLDADFPDPDRHQGARRLLLWLRYADAARRQMDQHPARRARPTLCTGSISATRSRRSPAGPRRRRTSGPRTSSATGTGTSCIIRPSRTRRTSGMACASGSRPRPRRRALHRHRPSAQVRPGIRQHRPDGVRRSSDGQASALLGLGLRADQGSGACTRPPGVRAGQLAHGPRLAQSGQGRLPGARRRQRG